MHKNCCLFLLVHFLLKWESVLNSVRNPVRGRNVDSRQTQKMTLQQVVLCFGATCLTALFGIQQLPGSLASSLSVGPQHLFPLLYRNFLYLARSWTLSICAQITVSLRAINSVILKVIFLFSSAVAQVWGGFFFFVIFVQFFLSRRQWKENMIQLGRTTKHFSPGLLNVTLSPCMLLTRCIAKSANYLPSQAQEK